MPDCYIPVVLFDVLTTLLQCPLDKLCFYVCLLSYPTTVQVGFEQAVYTVNEGDNVTVCATIMNGRLSRMISVSVDVLPGTASGVGSGKLNCMV